MVLNMVNKGKQRKCSLCTCRKRITMDQPWLGLALDQAPAHVLSLTSVKLLAAILYCSIAIFLQKEIETK